MKFKIGDRVKCIEIVDGNEKVLHQVGTIIDCGFSLYDYVVEFDKKIADTSINKIYDGKPGHMWCVHEGDIVSANETIVIYRKGREVIALDKSTGKKAIARCNPEDNFDFNTGAKLAFERLVPKATFRILALKNDTPYFTKGNVYEFVDEKVTWDNKKTSYAYKSFNDFIDRNPGWKDYVVELKDGDDPAEILKKYDNEIKVGDKVKVVKSGLAFTTYVTWVDHYVKHNISLMYKYDYAHQPIESHDYFVRCIGKHLDSNKLLAYIEDLGTHRCYVIDVEGLKKW